MAALGVLVLLAALLVWFLPARWALPWIAPRLHGLRLQQVRGQLWDGRAGQVRSADGRLLGQLSWRLSRRALVGQLQARLAFKGAYLEFSGTMRQIPDARMEWHDARLLVDLAELKPDMASPLGQPRGQLQVTIAHALLQGGWPLQLQAQAQWRHAVMRTHDGDVVLGDLHADVLAQGGVIQVRLLDDGQGPLQVDGHLQLSPLGWRLDAALHPRQTDPALRHWLAGLGRPDAEGTLHIQRSGGLAGSHTSAAIWTQERP
jgi:general secretion pathway protein N